LHGTKPSRETASPEQVCSNRETGHLFGALFLKGESMIIIDEEFRKQIPPLLPEERALLEESIRAEGLREAVTVWPTAKGHVLIDGHNRYEICRELGFDPRCSIKHFDSREEAADWIDRNQLGRRNLSPDNFRMIIGRRYSRTKREAGRPAKCDQNDHITGGTAESIAKQHGVSEPTVRRAGSYYDDLELLKQVDPEIETRTMAGQGPTVRQAREAAAEVEANNPGKAAEILKVPHVARNKGENEWYTPPEIIDAAVDVMGSISCDPASCAKANETVNADVYYDKEADGLANKWHGNVWLNPPYAQPHIKKFCEAVAFKYATGEISQAIVLVNNATETAWFSELVKASAVVCFPVGRVKFLDPDGNEGAPLQGQAIVGIGVDVAAFRKAFGVFGNVLEVMR
jgi:phage N-6-adenine-methyltransferase